MNKKTTIIALFLVLAAALVTVVGLFEWNSVTSEATALKLVLFPIFPVFLGALLAYQVQQDAENRRVEDRRVDALRRNMIKLTSMLNEVAALLHVLKENDGVRRELQMPAIIPPKNVERITPSELAFVLDAACDNNLLTELSTFQITFDMAVFALQERNALYRDFLLPALSENNITNYDNPKLAGIMNSNFGKKLKAETDNLYLHMPALLQSGLTLAERLARTSKTLFPRRTFILPQIASHFAPPAAAA